MGRRLPRAQPRRPAQLPGDAQLQSRHFVALQHQADVPIELETEIEPDPVGELAEQGPARAVGGGRRQKGFVLGQRERTQVNPELALVIPDASPEHGARSERGAFAAQVAPLRRRQPQPVADELLDRRRHAEELTDDRRQTLGVPDVPHQCSGVMEPRQIRNRVAVPQRLGSGADERADVDEKPIVVGPIAVDVRLGLSPRAVEQRDEPVMKQIEEAAQRRVAGMPQAMPCVLGEVNRQRAVRTEQTEEPDLQPRRGSILPPFERGERRGGKRHVGILSKPHGLVYGPERRAPPWLVVVQALEPPQRLVEVVPIRLPRQLCEKVQSVGLVPQVGAHRLISPRLCDRNTVSVTELIDT